MLDGDDLYSLSYRELQALAMKMKIPANMKVEIIIIIFVKM